MMIKKNNPSSKILLLTPRIGAYSFIGRRKNNEDASYYAVIKTIIEDNESFYVVVVVADGMGGCAKGEVASRIASTNIGSYLTYYCSLIGEGGINVDYIHALEYAFTLANNKIIQLVNSNPQYEGMGAAVTAVIIERKIDEVNIWIGHVGDTKVYVITREYIKQLTKDHSLVQELIDLGRLTIEQAKRHPQRNVITRALGLRDAKPDIINARLEEGSYVLVCSDGLVGSLFDNEIHRIIVSNVFRYRSPTYVLSKLVKTAISRGEGDNITGVLVGPLYSLR